VAQCDSIRQELIRYAKSRRTRTTTFKPHRWQPTALTDPRSGQAFTEEGAWEYVVEQLEAGVTIYKMTLDIPQGKTGYYFLMASNYSEKKIYVKLQICGNSVRGRSFHYEHDTREDD